MALHLARVALALGTLPVLLANHPSRADVVDFNGSQADAAGFGGVSQSDAPGRFGDDDATMRGLAGPAPAAIDSVALEPNLFDREAIHAFDQGPGDPILSFTAAGIAATSRFAGVGPSGTGAESGVPDNVEVGRIFLPVMSVPEPGGMALIGTFAICAGAVRVVRRRLARGG